jgi:hypothetical protein
VSLASVGLCIEVVIGNCALQAPIEMPQPTLAGGAIYPLPAGAQVEQGAACLPQEAAHSVCQHLECNDFPGTANQHCEMLKLQVQPSAIIVLLLHTH